jgi:hypothetical protein
MSKVLDAPPASSPGNTDTQQQTTPSYSERTSALTGKARDHWKLTGDLDAAEALIEKPEVKTTTADSSPADADETSDSAPETVDPEETPKPESEKAKARREKNERRWTELFEERGRMKAQIEALEQQLVARTTSKTDEKTPPVQAKDHSQDNAAKRPVRPRLDQFSTVEQYEAAMDSYETAVDAYNDRKAEERSASERHERERSVRESGWSQQVEQAKAKYKDFDQVAFSKDTPASESMISALKSHREGAEIAYHLGKHPEIAQALAQATHLPDLAALQRSNPVQAAYLVGKAEAIVAQEFDRIAKMLSGKPPSEKKETPLPPKPTSEVAVVPKGKTFANDEEMLAHLAKHNFAAYKELMNKRDAERFSRGA